MIPAIWIFVDGESKPYQVEWIKNLIANGIEPCVDGQHRNDEEWRKANFSKCPHRFYSKKDNVFYTAEDSWDECDLVIAFNDDEVLDEKIWMTLFIWVTEDFINDCTLIDKPDTIKIGSVKVAEAEKDEGYGFNTFLTDADIMFYQVKKPMAEMPYTTYTEDFSVNGHLNFFTNLFICESWGCTVDVMFLKEIWKFLGMSGECNIEKLYEERVQRCINGEKEPVVYRAFIDDVMQTVKDAKNGVECGHKRKSESTGNKNKK